MVSPSDEPYFTTSSGGITASSPDSKGSDQKSGTSVAFLATTALAGPGSSAHSRTASAPARVLARPRPARSIRTLRRRLGGAARPTHDGRLDAARAQEAGSGAARMSAPTVVT
ncbi:hypothetical protein [Streptomyces sp. NPDC001307]|uniref:hypothetical protein n=1 Tax=Streptomyces sp. NPDC001307 TaxID=3364560 RepID=UPI003685F179